MTQIAAAPQRRNLALWSLVLLGVGLLSLLPLSLVNTVPRQRPQRQRRPLRPHPHRLLRVRHPRRHAVARRPAGAATSRTKLLSVPHAPEYGVIPSLSPDRRSVAYTVLPPETPAPGPDAPAELWVALPHRRQSHGSSPPKSTCWCRRSGRRTARASSTAAVRFTSQPPARRIGRRRAARKRELRRLDRLRCSPSAFVRRQQRCSTSSR